MESGVICLAAWEGDRIVAYDLLGPTGADDVTASNGTCIGLNLHERCEARGRGIGLALLAASLPYTRELGFTRQATIVLERNRPMIAAATQILGFAVTGRAERLELAGPRALELAAARVGVRGPAPRRLNFPEIAGGTALLCR